MTRIVEQPWNDPRSYLGDASYEARAATASRPSLLRVSGIAGIAIASHFPAAMLGFFAGMMATVGLAYVWSFFL